MRTNYGGSVSAKNSKIKLTRRPPEGGWASLEGLPITLVDRKTGKGFLGRVRLKSVRCGKKGCTRCPHHIYAYAQFRDGKKVREKYLGVARQTRVDGFEPDRARVIEINEAGRREWYYLSPDAPAEIRTRDELIKYSLGRGAPNRYMRYEVEVREDLARV